MPAPGGGGSAPAPQRPRGSRGPRRARASFVDESLFGSPAGARPAPPAFAPPWAAAAVNPGGGGGPRPSSKWRLRGHTPSFCDESLFGAEPRGAARAAPRLRKADVAKLHPLLWSPPPAPRNQPGLSPAPLRAGRPPAPAAGPEVGPEGTGCAWKRPGSGPGSGGRGAPGRGRSQSLSRLNASDGLCLAAGGCETQSPLTAPVTPRGPPVRGQSGPPVGGCKARPPWK